MFVPSRERCFVIRDLAARTRISEIVNQKTRSVKKLPRSVMLGVVNWCLKRLQ